MTAPTGCRWRCNEIGVQQMSETTIHAATLESALVGWVAMLFREGVLLNLTLGHPTEQAALKRLARRRVTASTPRIHSVLQSVEAFLQGRFADLNTIEIANPGVTAFQRRVYDACRAIPFGETRTYGQLAADAGSPNAARAVGTCMAKNTIALVVPCHRVVRSGGGLGKYTAPGGSETKRRLLEIERKMATDSE